MQQKAISIKKMIKKLPAFVLGKNKDIIIGTDNNIPPKIPNKILFNNVSSNRFTRLTPYR